MNTDYMYLFIYHVCMHLMKMCGNLYTMHLWTYLKIKRNVFLKKKRKTLPQHQVTQLKVYIKYLFSEVNVKKNNSEKKNHQSKALLESSAFIWRTIFVWTFKHTVSKIYPIIFTECFIRADSEINFLLLSHVWQDYVLKVQSNIFINAHVMEDAFILKWYREDLSCTTDVFNFPTSRQTCGLSEHKPQSTVHLWCPAGSLHLSGPQTGNKMNVILQSLDS